MKEWSREGRVCSSPESITSLQVKQWKQREAADLSRQANTTLEEPSKAPLLGKGGCRWSSPPCLSTPPTNHDGNKGLWAFSSSLHFHYGAMSIAFVSNSNKRKS